MTTTSIKDIQNSCSNGQVIDGIRVTIVDTYEHRAVNTKNGATSAQNIKIKDETGFIFATLWGQNDASTYKGQTFFIQSKQTPRGKAGVTVADKADKTGALKRSLNISASAIVQQVTEGGGAPAPQAQTQPQNQSAKPQPKAVGLDELSNFWEHCYVSASKRQAKFGFSDEIKQGCAASLFIQGTRDGLHFALNDPAPWATVNTATGSGTPPSVSGVIEAGLHDGGGSSAVDDDVPF